MAEEKPARPERQYEPRRAALKDKFQTERGYWNGFWDLLLRDDPDYFEAYLNFSSAPWRHGSLAPKVKEFIYIAIDTSATHMFKPGLRIHVQNALKHGATRAEIMEVLELSSEMGIHSCSTGMPILVEEMHALGLAPETPPPLSAAQVALRERFIAVLGDWHAGWEQLLAMAPEFFAAYLEMAEVPRRGTQLDAKTKELVLIGLSAAVTALHHNELRSHIRRALQLGATPAEVAEVLQLISVLGIHAFTLGMPTMLEEIKATAAQGPSAA